MKENYVYVYCDPTKPGRFSWNDLPFSLLYEPFYVGKGSGIRMMQHLRCIKWKENKPKTNLKKNARIREIHKKTGAVPYVEKLAVFLDDKTAKEFETKCICTIGRTISYDGPLLNFTRGGEHDFTDDRNPGHWRKGKSRIEVWGEERARKMGESQSKKMRGRNNPTYGISIKERIIRKHGAVEGEIRYKKWQDRQNEAHKGKSNGMYGISMIERLMKKHGPKDGKRRYESWKRTCSLAQKKRWDSTSQEQRKRHGSSTVKVFAESKVAMMIKEYLLGTSLSKIAEQVGSTKGTISRILKQEGIRIRGTSEHRNVRL